MTLPKIQLPKVHVAVNIAGLLTTVGSTVAQVAISNPTAVAGLLPAKDSLAVTAVLGVLAAFMPTKRTVWSKPTVATQTPLVVSLNKEDSNMASVTGSVADALVAGLEQPAVQSALVAAISAGEIKVEDVVDAAINAVQVKGALGLIAGSSVKSALTSAVNGELATLTPTEIAAFLTKLAQEGAKELGG